MRARLHQRAVSIARLIHELLEHSNHVQVDFRSLRRITPMVMASFSATDPVGRHLSGRGMDVTRMRTNTCVRVLPSWVLALIRGVVSITRPTNELVVLDSISPR